MGVLTGDLHLNLRSAQGRVGRAGDSAALRVDPSAPLCAAGREYRRPDREYGTDITHDQTYLDLVARDLTPGRAVSSATEPQQKYW